MAQTRTAARRNSGGRGAYAETVGGERIPARLVEQAKRRYESFHWGISHKKITHIKDGILPEVLTQVGSLKSMFIRSPEGEYELIFPKGCHLAFDPVSKSERLYVVTPDWFRNNVRNLLKYDRARLPLNEIAKAAGGRQVKYKLPEMDARPLAVVTHVIYRTTKQGDGTSDYIHTLGEDTMESKFVERVPILAADNSGRLWLCGGAYSCPDPGITD